ncbi:MAG: ATP-binding protein, partial [Pseudomonas sp.]|nr:ATP-binding protein [Pseudomonas sp.]
LGNLLRNAWHYTNSGQITLRLHEQGFVVEDTGVGIAEDERENVFQPFVRGTAARGDGLGLGLSLVRRICISQGWRVELSAMQPQGCRFEVNLLGV